MNILHNKAQFSLKLDFEVRMSMGKIVKGRRREDDRARSLGNQPPPPALFISSKLRQNFHQQLFWSRVFAFRNFCKILSVRIQSHKKMVLL